jgi:hypothetical protein
LEFTRTRRSRTVRPRDLNRSVTRPRHALERLTPEGGITFPRTLNRNGRRRSRFGVTLEVTAGIERAGLGARVVNVRLAPALRPFTFRATIL